MLPYLALLPLSAILIALFYYSKEFRIGVHIIIEMLVLCVSLWLFQWGLHIIIQ